MFALAIGIVVILMVFGFVVWVFFCLISSRISKGENEREFRRDYLKAGGILERRHDKNV